MLPTIVGLKKLEQKNGVKERSVHDSFKGWMTSRRWAVEHPPRYRLQQVLHIPSAVQRILYMFVRSGVGPSRGWTRRQTEQLAQWFFTHGKYPHLYDRGLSRRQELLQILTHLDRVAAHPVPDSNVIGLKVVACSVFFRGGGDLGSWAVATNLIEY